MKGVQCYELFGGIALKNHTFSFFQIVSTLSNRHPPKISPTIYPSADLPSIFIKHFTNKVEKHRANIASEHVTSTLVSGTLLQLFIHFKKGHNQQFRYHTFQTFNRMSRFYSPFTQ